MHFPFAPRVENRGVFVVSSLWDGVLMAPDFWATSTYCPMMSALMHLLVTYAQGRSVLLFADRHGAFMTNHHARTMSAVLSTIICPSSNEHRHMRFRPEHPYTCTECASQILGKLSLRGGCILFDDLYHLSYPRTNFIDASSKFRITSFHRKTWRPPR